MDESKTKRCEPASFMISYKRWAYIGLKENLNNLMRVRIFNTVSFLFTHNYLINSRRTALRSHLANPM